MSSVEIDFDRVADIAYNEWESRNARPLVETVKNDTPVDKGDLRASIRYVRDQGKRGGTLEAGTDHALIVHTGHGEILPRKPGGVLTWLDKLTGQRVFTRRVGPVPANPYLVRGARRFGLRVQSD